MIYIASTTENDYYAEVYHALRSAGHDVYCPLVAERYPYDYAMLRECDACVMLSPREGEVCSYVEAGWAAGHGKPVLAYMIDESDSSFVEFLFDGVYSTTLELVRALSELNTEESEVESRNLDTYDETWYTDNMFIVRHGDEEDERILNSTSWTNIVGMRYHPAYEYLKSDIKENSKITLMAEPENTKDPGAIAAYFKGEKIGYVSADMTDFVRLFLDKEGQLETGVSEVKSYSIALYFHTVISRPEEVETEASDKVRCFECLYVRENGEMYSLGYQPVWLSELAEKLSPDYVKPSEKVLPFVPKDLLAEKAKFLGKEFDPEEELTVKRLSELKVTIRTEIQLRAFCVWQRIGDEAPEDDIRSMAHAYSITYDEAMEYKRKYRKFDL